MLAKLAELEAEHAKAVAGGGERYAERHQKRGKLLARERIELLLDEGSPFLELMPLAGWGSDFTVGASLVTGIGVVEGVECMIVANDPTVKGGASNPWTLKKSFRAAQIAAENRLPDDQPRRVRRRRSAHAEGDLHPRRADLPRHHPVERRQAPDGRAGLRQLHRRRRLRPRDERLRRHGQGGRQGVPRRPAAGQDGDRRGVRRRVARRRGDARPGLRARRLPRRRRGGRDPDRPAHRRPAQPPQAAAPAAPTDAVHRAASSDAERAASTSSRATSRSRSTRAR